VKGEPMKFGERKVGANVVVEVHEPRLGADKATAFKEVVGRYREVGDSGSIILDLSQVVFIDSSGLGAILSILKRMPKGTDLVICGATEPVMSMFKLTRLDRVLTMRATVDEALNALAL
jgi:anti-sigma B factor antagonist